MSSGYFSVGIYGQSGLVMDWFGLNDPFTQQFPVKITNNWSGTIWVQGELITPPTGVYTAYSGVSMSGVSAGASATAVMTWNVNVSGQTATSSPVTHALTLGLLAFTSSNYTGALASGNFAFNNTLFSRWSGVIKVFGDQYSNDQPIPSVQAGGGGTLASGYAVSYAISYILSGWESDIGVPTTYTPTASNTAANISWSSIVGATQYLLYRWSGSADFTLYSGTTTGGGTMRPMDLVYASNQLSYTDGSQAVFLTSGFFRHRTWQRASTTSNFFISDVSVYLSPPASKQNPGVTALWAHGYQLNKNLSGTSLLGPFYGVFHERFFNVAPSIALQTGIDGYISGTTLVDGTALVQLRGAVWYRHGLLLGASGSLSASGDIHLQFETADTTDNLDDVFICAQS